MAAGTVVEMTMAAEARECSILRHRVRELSMGAGFDEESASELELGVSEAFANAVRYGSSEAQDVIRATIRAKVKEIIVELHYRGDGFSHELPKSDEICLLENGGLGRYLMYRLLDDVHYKFDLGYTSLRMIKRCR